VGVEDERPRVQRPGGPPQRVVRVHRRIRGALHETQYGHRRGAIHPLADRWAAAVRPPDRPSDHPSDHPSVQRSDHLPGGASGAVPTLRATVAQSVQALLKLAKEREGKQVGGGVVVERTEPMRYGRGPSRTRR
jgi:hypothetical protein